MSIELKHLWKPLLLLLGFSILVKVISVLSEITLAKTFGVGDALDAFFAALLMPNFFLNIFLTAVVAAIVPVYMRLSKQTEKARSAEFLLVVSVAVGLLLLILMAALLLSPRYYLPLIASGYSAEKQTNTIQLIWVVAPSILFSGIGAVWRTIFYVNKRYAVAIFSSAITPSLMLGSLLLWSNEHGTKPVAFAFLVGCFAESVLLGSLLFRDGYLGDVLRRSTDIRYLEIGVQFVFVFIAAVIMASTTVITQSVAATLGAGSVSAWNFANKIVSLPLDLSATLLMNIVLPLFSNFVAVLNFKNLFAAVRKITTWVLLGAVPIAGLFFLFAQPLVHILFEHGAFGHPDTLIVAPILRLLSLQIPFFLAAIVLSRLVISFGRNQILTIICCLNVLFLIAATKASVPLLGMSGIALSVSLTQFLGFTLLWFAKKRLEHEI